MPDYKEEKLPLEKLLLDPNNYRFQEVGEFVYAKADRFHEATVQARAFKVLKEAGNLGPLKASILRNGFIPVERLVVRKYEAANDKFLIIEGNRRLAALKWIAEDDAAGLSIPQSVKDVLQQIPVIIVEGDTDGLFQRALMGVRHVSGIDQWGGYQRAKLVVELRDDFGLEPGEVAERLGMKANEVNRRYRAFKALQQMQKDEEYSDVARPEMYPMFHEAVSLPAVKEWLGWDENTASFTKSEELRQFYSLLVPWVDEDDQERDPKITTKDEVRELRNIITNSEARAVLLDPKRSFFEALALAKTEELSKNWMSDIAAAINALKRIGVLELVASTSEQRSEIAKLRDLANEMLTNYDKLKQ